MYVGCVPGARRLLACKKRLISTNYTPKFPVFAEKSRDRGSHVTEEGTWQRQSHDVMLMDLFLCPITGL